MRIIARLLTSLNIVMAKESTWLMKGSEQEMETMTKCSQRKLFMLDPQKDNARRKQVSVREETISHVQELATNDAQSLGDMTTV